MSSWDADEEPSNVVDLQQRFVEERADLGVAMKRVIYGALRRYPLVTLPS